MPEGTRNTRWAALARIDALSGCLGTGQEAVIIEMPLRLPQACSPFGLGTFGAGCGLGCLGRLSGAL